MKSRAALAFLMIVLGLALVGGAWAQSRAEMINGNHWTKMVSGGQAGLRSRPDQLGRLRHRGPGAEREDRRILHVQGLGR